MIRNDFDGNYRWVKIRDIFLIFFELCELLLLFELFGIANDVLELI